MLESLDKDKVARCFLQGQHTYDEHATVQKKVSQKLVGLLNGFPQIDYNRVFEIGCCTGTMTEELLHFHEIKKLFLNDLVPDFFPIVQKKLFAKKETTIEPIFGDIEKLQFPLDLDLVISSSTFQWLTDLERFFANVANALNQNGYLVFSIFGPGTLIEFKKLTGIGLEYTSLGRMLEIMENEFVIEYADTLKDILYFETPRDVLRHLKATGVGGVSEHRWSTQGILEFEANYFQEYGSTEGVPVTFVSSLVIATKNKK